MRLNDLKKGAAKARQDFQRAEREAEEPQRKFEAARLVAEQALLRHEEAQERAEQVRCLALAAEDRVGDRLRIWEKAQKRLAQALKKVSRAKAGRRTRRRERKKNT